MYLDWSLVNLQGHANPDSPRSSEYHFPCTFVDEDGKIILWHLPGVISTSLQNRTVRAIKALLEEQPEILQNANKAYAGLSGEALFSYSGFAVGVSPGVFPWCFPGISESPDLAKFVHR